MKILYLLLFIGLFYSCSGIEHKNFSSNKPISDTTKIIELAIKQAFYGNLPDASAVKNKYYYPDSILLSTDALPLYNLPTSVDSLRFKILPQNDIHILIQNDSLSYVRPNYLYIDKLEKQDSGYYVQISSKSALNFGGGGILGIYLQKIKDTIAIVSQQASSIN
jgi:hypothetical protein